MSNRPAFLEIKCYVFRRDVASTGRQGNFPIGEEVKNESLRRAENLAVSAV
jgi:hypothetical protein